MSRAMPAHFEFERLLAIHPSWTFGIFLLSNVCAMFHAWRRIACFDSVSRDLYLLSGPGDIVRCDHRARKDRDRGEAHHRTASAGLQNRSGRNGLLYMPMRQTEPSPLLILLHKAGGSPTEWFSGRRIIRALCGEGPFHYSCAGFTGRKLGNRTEKMGLRLCGDQSRFGRSVCPGARLIGTGSPSAGSLTEHRMRFHLAWPTAMYSATSSRFRRALSLRLRRAGEGHKATCEFRLYILPMAQQIMSCQSLRRAASS